MNAGPRSAHMAYVELRNVRKEFRARDGKPFIALEGVNLQIERSEFVSVIGHSGCGKSTVLNLLAGLLPVSGGEIRVGDELVDGPGPDRMVAFQNHSLLPWLTIRQNIELAVDQVHAKKPSAERRKMVDELLEVVHLTAAAERFPNQVSGGMKQRCGIARAFATRPKLLLLDEPFGALDALTRANLQDELIKLWEAERVTVMMITHDVDEALLLSDRIVMMSNGPAAHVAEIMKVELPRPRSRLSVMQHPSYYRQRGELIYYLNKCKRAKSGPAVEAPAGPAAATGPAPLLASGLERDRLRVGFVPLLDCAPFAVAQAEGLFAKYKLEVELSREPSWKAIADGVREGRLDAAQMVAGMPIAETAGLLGRTPFAIRSALTLNRGGNAITFGNQLLAARVSDRELLQRYVQLQKAQGQPALTFGVVHPASMHNLLLRSWLAAAGIAPGTDIKLAMVPPPQMVANLEQGGIVGFCAGEPWNTRAVHAKLGAIAATDSDIWPAHPEKVLGVSRLWAERHPQTHIALVCALLEACALCDDPHYRAQRLPALLATPEFVAGHSEDFAPALSGRFVLGEAGERASDDFLVFSKHGANLTRRNEAHWILAQMVRWGMLAYPEQASSFIDGIFGEAVLAEAAAKSGRPLPPQDDSPLQIDGFVFDPLAPSDYLKAVQSGGDRPSPSQPTPAADGGKVVAA